MKIKTLKVPKKYSRLTTEVLKFTKEDKFELCNYLFNINVNIANELSTSIEFKNKWHDLLNKLIQKIDEEVDEDISAIMQDKLKRLFIILDVIHINEKIAVENPENIFNNCFYEIMFNEKIFQLLDIILLNFYEIENDDELTRFDFSHRKENICFDIKEIMFK